MVYVPREDSKLLLKWVVSRCSGSVLDMGCGSGVLGLGVVSRCNVTFVDVDLKAVNDLRSKGHNAVLSDLFEDVSGSFDWIVFNPPYLPYDSLEPFDMALCNCGGLKGCELLDRFLDSASEYLNSNGKLLILFSSLSGFSFYKHIKWRFVRLDSLKLGFEELYVYLCSLS